MGAVSRERRSESVEKIKNVGITRSFSDVRVVKSEIGHFNWIKRAHEPFPKFFYHLCINLNVSIKGGRKYDGEKAVGRCTEEGKNSGTRWNSGKALLANREEPI